MDKLSLSPERKLELGIEIVAAMKASLYDWDIESGRIDALSETEMDRIDLSPEEFEALPFESKNLVRLSVAMEKSRLHKQANFAAEVVCEWLVNEEKATKLNTNFKGLIAPIVIVIGWILFFAVIKRTNSDHFKSGYKAGLDTAEVIYNKRIKPLVDSVRNQTSNIDIALKEMDSMEVTSFPDHSQLRREVSGE